MCISIVRMIKLLSLVGVMLSMVVPTVVGDGYGHGHSSIGIGTACIVKGSYCQCHYCKCEKGHIHCKGHGHGGGYGQLVITISENRKYLLQGRSTAMEVWRGSTATVTTASASMDLVKMGRDTRGARDTDRKMNSNSKPSFLLISYC